MFWIHPLGGEVKSLGVDEVAWRTDVQGGEKGRGRDPGDPHGQGESRRGKSLQSKLKLKEENWASVGSQELREGSFKKG